MADGTASTELVSIPKVDALTVFTTPEKIEPILARIRQEIDGFVPDISSKRGRDNVASMAYRVARSKTYLEGVGKETLIAAANIPHVTINY